MNPKWRALAADLLDRAAEEFSNHGCNSCPWPADWTEAEQREIAVAMDAANRNSNVPDEAEVRSLMRCPADWWLMRFLARCLRE